MRPRLTIELPAPTVDATITTATGGLREAGEAAPPGIPLSSRDIIGCGCAFCCVYGHREEAEVAPSVLGGPDESSGDVPLSLMGADGRCSFFIILCVCCCRLMYLLFFCSHVLTSPVFFFFFFFWSSPRDRLHLSVCLSVCVYVCVYVYICVCMCVYVCVCVCECVCVCVCVCVYVCMCVSLCGLQESGPCICQHPSRHTGDPRTWHTRQTHANKNLIVYKKNIVYMKNTYIQDIYIY